MKLPIWIASWEIECCQPDAIVGTEWTTYPFVNAGSLPWWVEKATQPIPAEVAEFGTITLTGTIANHDDRTTITTSGITLPIHGTPPKPPFDARLVVDAHTDTTFPVTGVVERVLGIKYKRINGWPIAQFPATELRSTSERQDGFDEYLVTLRTAENRN
jgi:hypothetical protein